MAIIEIVALSIFSASLVLWTSLLFVHNNNDLKREHILSTYEYSNIDDASNGKPFVK